jgi:hypothetical protein
MAKRKAAKKPAKKAAKKSSRKGAQCVKSGDCRVIVARQDFNAAKSCGASRQASQAFRETVAKRFRFLPQAEREKLYREALRKEGLTASRCGEEEKAARIQAALSKRDTSDDRNMDSSYTSSFEGLRRSRRRR